jgi:hypothetical protein
MALIHVSGANPYCRTCDGTGVKPLFGYGSPCHCTEGIADPYKHAREEGRKAADRAFERAIEQAFGQPLSQKTTAALKAVDDMTVVSPERK